MQDMMKMYNMYGMDPNMFGGQEVLCTERKSSSCKIYSRKSGIRVCSGDL